MTENLAALLYLVASVCFIMALKGLSSPETARHGNIYGIAGMVIAIGTTLALPIMSGFQFAFADAVLSVQQGFVSILAQVAFKGSA